MSLRAPRYAEHVPRDPSSPWFGEHLARYRRAAQDVDGATALDIACGPGIGFGELVSGGTRLVVGVDLDPVALDEAAGARRATIALVRADGTALPLADGAFTRITCFETIEHVDDDLGLVAELARVLAPGGTALISTPNALITKPVDGRPRNPFHRREYRPDELTALLATHFADVTILGQRPAGRYVGSGFWERQPGARGLASWVGMRLAVRVPRPALTALERVRHRPTFPGPDDFAFDAIAATSGHALLAVCRGPR